LENLWSKPSVDSLRNVAVSGIFFGGILSPGADGRQFNRGRIQHDAGGDLSRLFRAEFPGASGSSCCGNGLLGAGGLFFSTSRVVDHLVLSICLG
jgi:hypothetical protein